MEEMDVASDDVDVDVGSYNIGSLIAHGSNKTKQTLENAITTIYGTLEGKRKDYIRLHGREIAGIMIPLFGDIEDRLFKKLFENTFIISACNFNNVCLSSSVIENVDDSNNVLQNIFKRSLFFYNDEEQALYYSRLMLRLTQVFYYFYELEKYIKEVENDTNYFSRYNDAYNLHLNVDDPNELYLIQIYVYIFILHNDKRVEYIKSVLSGVTSILSNLDKIMQFIYASKDTIDIIQKVFEHFEKFIYFMNVVNANKSILKIDTVMASFGLHYVTKSTSVKNINLTDPIRFGRGLHLSNIKNIDNDIVIATDSELEKMRNEYPSMEAELIQKYITHPFMPRNKFDFMLNDLIDIIKTEKITNAHILLFMLLLNYDNEDKLILVDFSCNGTDEFDEATCVLRAPPRTKSFTGLGVRKTNKNKQKKNLKKKKTVNKRKQKKTKKRRRKSAFTYA
jgi:hypothetical protein